MSRQKWIEFIEPVPMGKRIIPIGHRAQYPIFAANGLIAAGKAIDAPGPYKDLPDDAPMNITLPKVDESEPVETVSETSDSVPEPQEGTPEATSESTGPDMAAEEESVKEGQGEASEAMSVSDFRELKAADQKSLLQSLGIATSKLTNEDKRVAAYEEHLDAQ